MATSLKGLKSFRNKVQKYSNLNARFNNELIEEVTTAGEQIAVQQYAGVSDVKVWHENLGSGRGRIIAQREGLSYIEFGTGDVGAESMYPETSLPQEGIPITGKWQYYYEPSEHKVTKNGKRGWMWGKQFVEGRPAGMQMYKTTQQLKERFKSILIKKLKGDGKSV